MAVLLRPGDPLPATDRYDGNRSDFRAIRPARRMRRIAPARFLPYACKKGVASFLGESRMVKPFNAFEAAILKALAEALFHGVDMAITPDQVVDNIQRQFSWFHGTMPRQIALSLW